MSKRELTSSELKARLHYSPETGQFTWIATGKTAGCAGARRYHLIRFNNHLYYAHQLAWLYVYGSWPNDDIDHCNRIGTDNRIENLREATRSQNIANTRMRENQCGYKGVIFARDRNKYRASIKKGGKQVWLGSFDSAEEASAAYEKAAHEMFGEFARAA